MRARRIVVAFALVTAATVMACSHVKLVEQTPMTAKLSAWRSISFDVVAGPQLGTDEGVMLATLQEELVDRVKRERFELSIRERDPSADLVMRVAVESIDHGAFLFANAELVASVDLVETRTNRVMARFELVTDSGGSSAPQYDFNFDSPTEVAVKRAAVRIVKWLKEQD